MLYIYSHRTFQTADGKGGSAFDRVDTQNIRSVVDLLADPMKYIGHLPPEKRVNLHYTLGDTTISHETHPVTGKTVEKHSWERQEVLPFDLDGVEVKADGSVDQRYIDFFCDIFGVEQNKIAVTLSGHGLHFVILLKKPIRQKSYFTEYRDCYATAYRLYTAKLRDAGLPYKEDMQRFMPNAKLRLPGTINRKPGLADTECRLINNRFFPYDIDLEQVSGVKKATREDSVKAEELYGLRVDVEAIESKCSFMRHAKNNPSELSEPEWYASMTLLTAFPNGQAKAHEYSRGHPGYSESATEQKFQQAKAFNKHRTCKNIAEMHEGCKTCPLFGTVRSPVFIKGDKFIASEHHGFYKIGKRDELIPQIEDLRLFYERETHYKLRTSMGVAYAYTGTHYTEVKLKELQNYAQTHFVPKPEKDKYVQEFVSAVLRDNLVPDDWFNPEGFVNFQNGALDISEADKGQLELHAHTPDRGFFNVLPYAYDEAATCPNWRKFLADVTLGDEDLQAMLMEFIGYAICDTKYRYHHALFLIGSGHNGKSTFIDVIRALFGEGNHTALGVTDLENDNKMRMLETSLLNLADELPKFQNKNSQIFKTITSGGIISAKKLWQDVYQFRIRTKFIFAGNDFFKSSDRSHGFYRRILYAPFEAEIVGDKVDLDMKDKLLSELPGIFNMALEHYVQLVKNKAFTVSKRTEAMLNDYKEENDVIAKWWQENYTAMPLEGAGEQDFVPSTTLYENYKEVMQQWGEQVLPMRAVFAALKHHVKDIHRRHGRAYVHGSRVRVIRGIKAIDENSPF